MIYNSVLKNSSEINFARKCLEEMGLFPHHGLEKSWDTYRMIEIINRANRYCNILDVGCHGSPILPMLKKLGFTNLYGCDFMIKPRRNPSIVKLIVNFVYRFYKREYLPIVQMYYDNSFNLSIQNLENTSYHDNMFDYITSLSVIEHGVNIHEYFHEMSRLLKKGGYLLTSTDYWPEKIINTRDIDSNENRDIVFCRSDIQEMVEIANKYSLKLIEPINYTHEKRLVSWKGVDYTFIFFGMRKE